MSINIPVSILDLKGQCVNEINCNQTTNTITIFCRRDKRFKPIDPNKQRGTINRYIRRTIYDLPLLRHRIQIEIELAQMLTKNNKRHIESCDFVDKGCYYTRRFCCVVSGLCRYMTISAVAKHFDLRWETVKNMDKQYLQDTLPTLNPAEIINLKYLGVDEVARAKGHDYMTVVYDLGTGKLIWVHEGRKSEIFSKFLKQLPDTTKQGILAVAMDMGPAYQKAVHDDLPNADIIFDRFHVMQNYSQAIDNQRRAEFRRADKPGKDLIRGSRFLLLKNSEKLTENQHDKLKILLQENENINLIYMLKEQLQSLWSYKTYDGMANALENWCQIANQTDMVYIKNFTKLLQRHKEGICNYAKHPITTEYFKLKIRQLSVPHEEPLFYRRSV